MPKNDKPLAPHPALQFIPRAQLSLHPDNPRKSFDDAELKELAASIAWQGILEPLIVRAHPKDKGGFQIIAGARRFKAAALAKLDTLPCIVRGCSDEDVLDLQLLENLQRADLHPLEEGAAFERYQKLGLDLRKIGAKVSKSASYVCRRLALHTELTPATKKAFRAGEIPLHVAHELARLHGAKQQDTVLAETLRRGETSQDGVRRDILPYCHATRDVRKAGFDVNAKDLVPGVGPCTTCPYRSGNQLALLEADGLKSENDWLCGNLPCFEDKSLAGYLAASERALAGGNEVLPPEQGKSLFYEGNGQLRYDSGYKEAEAREFGQRHSFGQLAKQLGAPVLTVRNPHSGRAVELVREADVRKKMKRERSGLSNEYANQNAAWRADREKRDAIEERLGEQLFAKLEKKLQDDKDERKFLRALLRSMIFGLDFESQAAALARRGLIEKPKSRNEIFKHGAERKREALLFEYAKSCTLVELRTLILELDLGSHLGDNPSPTSIVSITAGEYGVDVGALAKKIGAEYTAEQKAKKAEKTKPKKAATGSAEKAANIKKGAAKAKK